MEIIVCIYLYMDIYIYLDIYAHIYIQIIILCKTFSSLATSNPNNTS